MLFNVPLHESTLATMFLVVCGAVVSVPVLWKGFKRRGSGVFYEKNFLIQRAPQFVSLFNVAVIVAAFFAFDNLVPGMPLASLLSLGQVLPDMVGTVLSWLGVVILLSGLIFMIGGWYSLGEYFTTDAEVLEDHKVRKNGLLAYVMHPAYSGIIQSLFGASLAALSPIALAVTVFLVAPLWLNRAKYEERLLIESLGESYKEYAEELKWRRLVPRFIPIGV
jgi:protein-S-isoprenylcysteine O-methyltransferase Ste14